jgi:RNA polymerase sigma-70 factor (ECF subfamily)
MHNSADQTLPVTATLPVTTTRLLEELAREPKGPAWDEFCQRYLPVLRRFAARVGIPAQDTDDVAQNAMMRFATAFRDGKYDRQRGRLRSYLFTIAASAASSHRRRERRHARSVSLNPEVAEQAADELERTWNETWREQVLVRCLAQLRGVFDDTTLEIFERFAMQGQPAGQVAAAFHTTPNAVYLAKRRVLGRIREFQQQMEDELL